MLEAFNDPGRGRILDREGNVLAESLADGSRYYHDASSAHAVGYLDPRYGSQGVEFVFTGEEADLELKAVNDQTLFLDLTGLKPEFVGEVKVGIKGRTKRILWNEVLIQ